MNRRGSLFIVGTGILGTGQITPDAEYWIREADRVFFLVQDPLSERWLKKANPAARSLAHLYSTRRPRAKTYEMMVETMLAPLRRGATICGAFYGHPGVFAHPTHEAIRRARAEGHRARMLPGISAFDCLTADLGLDPGRDGCHTYEATSFLLEAKKPDPTTALVLWQISVIGESRFRKRGFGKRNLEILAQRLADTYGAEHEVVIYEAAALPGFEASVIRVPLNGLSSAKVSGLSTLYVPPLEEARMDQKMGRRLRLRWDELLA